MATTLTARFCEAVRPLQGRQVAYPDGDVKGLELRVSAEGRKVWSFRYRNQDGSQRRMTLGVFSPTQPEAAEEAEDGTVLDLRQARIKARRIRAAVDEGKDPAAVARRAKAKSRAEPLKTFDDLADAFLKASAEGKWMPRNKRKRASTIAGETRSLRLHIRPVIGKDRLEDIDRRAVKRLLTNMRDAGIGAQTNKAHAVIRQVYGYGIDQERVTENPATGFKAVAVQKARTRTLNDAELKVFWGALGDPSGLRLPPKGDEEGANVQVSRPVRIALMLATLLLVRRSEVAGMTISELDLDRGLWLIPAERMKGGVAHLVPLPPRAVELIREAIKLASWPRNQPPTVVFPSPRDAERSIRPDSLTHAMAELIAAMHLPSASPHDLRRTGSTALTSERLGVSPFIRSKVLGHSTDTGGGAAVSSEHYDMNTYLVEKRRALEAWQALLLEIVGEVTRPGNVRPMKRKAG